MIRRRSTYGMGSRIEVLLCWLTLSGCENKKNPALSEYWASDSQAAESL